jgi:hypothetical protein
LQKIGIKALVNANAKEAAKSAEKPVVKAPVKN